MSVRWSDVNAPALNWISISRMNGGENADDGQNLRQVTSLERRKMKHHEETRLSIGVKSSYEVFECFDSTSRCSDNDNVASRHTSVLLFQGKMKTVRKSFAIVFPHSVTNSFLRLMAFADVGRQNAYRCAHVRRFSFGDCKTFVASANDH